MSQDKRQRQKENRRLRQEAERKAARRAMIRRRGIQFGSLLAFLVVVLGFMSWRAGNAENAAASTTTSTAITATTNPTATTVAAADAVPASYADYRELPVACGGELPPERTTMQFESPVDQGIAPTDQVTVTMSTSCGDLMFELDPASAPETVNSFVFLAREGYFDGTVLHRIMDGSIFQGGDPTATGTGGPGYTIPDELPSDGFVYVPGTLAMANSGLPDSGGSQFFVVLGDQAATLPPAYSVFGQVVDSEDAINAIASIEVAFSAARNETSVPMEAVYINSVVVDIQASQ